VHSKLHLLPRPQEQALYPGTWVRVRPVTQALGASAPGYPGPGNKPCTRGLGMNALVTSLTCALGVPGPLVQVRLIQSPGYKRQPQVQVNLLFGNHINPFFLEFYRVSQGCG